MDPVSVSLRVAGVLPLIIKIIASTDQYAKAVVGSKKMITSLIAELEMLQTSINNLQLLLNSHTVNFADVKFNQSSVLISCSDACEIKLRDLYNKLNKELAHNNTGRYLWPFKESHHERILSEIRNFTNWIQFALTVDGCRLLSKTTDNVMILLGQQLDQFAAIQRIEAKTDKLLDSIQTRDQIRQDEEDLKHRNQILNWICTAKYTTRHDTLQKARTANTGGWLLKSDNYISWRDRIGDSRVLWLNGVRGSGKSILTSFVIDELRNFCKQPSRLIGFFYFDHLDHESQTVYMVMLCILRQLLEGLADIPKSVSELFEIRKGGEAAPIYECERIITEIIKGSETTYIIIEALDECDNTKSLKPILQFIERLSQISSCRMLVTSRPYVINSSPALPLYEQIKIEANAEDIRRYLIQECAASDIHQIASQTFVNQLVEKLIEGASGMFLLPVLQLRTLLDEPTAGDMQDKLDQLSSGLSDAFSNTIARIHKLSASRRRLALSALMHLAHAKRPFKIEELSDLLALKHTSTSISASHRPTTKTILESCQGLVLLDQQTNQIRLAHYAIQEYLVANAQDIFLRVEVNMALDYLKYLILDHFKGGPLDTDEEIEARLASYPFLGYASIFWGDYVQKVEQDPDIWGVLFEFYSSKGSLASSVQAMSFVKNYHMGYYHPDECWSFTTLHLVARNGLEHSVRHFLTINPTPTIFDTRTLMGTTPIIHASSNGHVAVVKELLDHGVDPNLENWYGNALHCAAESGQVETIRQLIQWGMDPNVESHGRTPLMCAMDHDMVQTFELLVDLGSKIDISDDTIPPSNTFYLACHWDCDKIVDLMLNRQWVDIGSNAAKNGLCEASPPILRRLIQAGADINAVDDEGFTALDHARCRGDNVAVRILLHAGANDEND